MRMGFGFVATQILAVSLPILLGWALNKLGIIGGDLDNRLSTLVLNVALPCSILASIDGAEALPDAGTLALLMLATGVTYIIAIAVALVMAFLLRDTEDARVSYRFAIAFGNCGFIGLPVVGAILGAEAVLYAAIALIPANVILFAVGPLFFIDATADAGRPADRLRGVLASLKTPTLAASVAVLVLALAGVNRLGVAGQALGIVGQMATPLALLITGSSMAHYRPLEMLGNPRAYVAAAGRLLIVPLASLIAVNLFPLSAFLRAVIVLDGAMPVATLGALYCLKSGRDTKPMMQVTFLSVVFSVVTIPLVSLVL